MEFKRDFDFGAAPVKPARQNRGFANMARAQVQHDDARGAALSQAQMLRSAASSTAVALRLGGLTSDEPDDKLQRSTCKSHFIVFVNVTE